MQWTGTSPTVATAPRASCSVSSAPSASCSALPATSSPPDTPYSTLSPLCAPVLAPATSLASEKAPVSARSIEVVFPTPPITPPRTPGSLRRETSFPSPSTPVQTRPPHEVCRFPPYGIPYKAYITIPRLFTKFGFTPACSNLNRPIRTPN